MNLARLQFITDSPALAEKACKSGIEWIQVRVKNADEKIWEEIATEIVGICKAHNVTCIINDNPYIAKYTNADGVHLGKDDISVAEARKLFEDKKMIIGGTANSIEDIKKLSDEKVNYIGLGPYRFTATKENLSPILGIEGYKNIMEQLKTSARIIPPIYAVGGIDTKDVEAIVSTGIYGLAVSSALSKEENMTDKINEFYSLIKIPTLNSLS